MENKIYASLHTHSMDRFDSQNNPEELCARFSELGAKGFALTQHGVLSAIEPTRKVAEKYGLKFVPGLETYYTMTNELDERRHMILLAKDDVGYHTICKAATDGNDTDGMSVMDESILKKYFAPGREGHGHVIATSACIQGVVAMTLRKNDVVNKKIAKAQRHQSKYGIAPDDRRILKCEEKLAKIEKEIESNKEEKASARKDANAKFTARERQIEKLRESNTTTPEFFKKMVQELENDKKRSETAKERLEQLTEDGKKLIRKRSVLNKELKELRAKAGKWKEDEKTIDSLMAQRHSDETLLKNASDDAKWFNDLFGQGNFYLEVQNHGIDIEAFVYPRIAIIARHLGIPLVATNDIHLITASEDEVLRRRILRSLRFGTHTEQEGAGDDQLYIKTDEELSDWLGKILTVDVVKEAMDNIKVVFDSCNVTFEHENHYPVYQTQSGKSAEEILEEEARKGIPWRFPNGFPDERYEERMNYELEIINSMGYANYHLVVKDYLEYGRELGAVPEEFVEDAPFDIEELKEWKKENGWDTGFSIGPGRGSAVGSLVCYLLGITALDPIKYDLLFERFLNPERVSMPDIDSDFSNTIRQKVIEYVQYKYGQDSVCGIMTTNAQAPKGAVRIAAKYYGYDCFQKANEEKPEDKKYRDGLKEAGKTFLSLADIIAKKVPNDPGTSFASIDSSGVTLYERLCNEYADNQDALTILKWAKTIEGCFTAYGAHAAGIVISDGTPIKNHIPLRWNAKLNEWTTQMDMVSVEENGFLKMDFLGLKTLDIITDCLKAIKKEHGRVIDPVTDIPLNDSRVFEEIMCKGRTKSVFQFESSGMRNMLQRFQPSSFEDLIILVAMFRPGPLQYLDGVIEVKHGKKAKYITKELVPLLENTYGAIVFQEQVMQIFQDLAGYTLGGADQVRRAMSKKKAKVLAAERPIFIHGIHENGRDIKGCIANGISEDAANELFDQMTDFAKYAFNRSHAAVYALIGYYTAWLKLYYPAEFLMAAMNWATLDDIPGLMQEAKKLGVTVKAPDVNRSGSKFVVSGGEILFGLGAIKSVGSAGDDILKERNIGGEFSSIYELVARTPANKRAIENLIKAGAFDRFCESRNAMIDALTDIQTSVKAIKESEKKIEELDFLIRGIEATETKQELEEFEQTHKLLSKNGTARDKEAILSSLSKKRINATTKLSETKNELSSRKFDLSLSETHDTRMSYEKEFLGTYVTAHPLDQYPEPEEIGITSIQDLEEGKVTAYGLIRDINIKFRKSDHKPMAFFTLEDKTGEIEVCVFTRQYERMRNLIAEGAVVIIDGNIEEQDDNNTKKLYAEKMTISKKRATTLKLSVDSFWAFAANDLSSFKKKYEDPNGHPLKIYDKLTSTYRTAKFRVSDDVKKLSNVKQD